MRTRGNRRRGNYNREDLRMGIYSNRDDVYRTNARDYEGRDYYEDIEIEREGGDRPRRKRSFNSERSLRRGRLRHTRASRNNDERSGDQVHNAWERLSNHDDRQYAYEYDNARLEREYGEGTRSGYGYSRYPAEEYGDYRSGPVDDLEYYEDVRHRAYNDTRYGEDGGYSDVYRGERNLDWIRHPRSRRRSRRERD